MTCMAMENDKSPLQSVPEDAIDEAGSASGVNPLRFVDSILPLGTDGVDAHLCCFTWSNRSCFLPVQRLLLPARTPVMAMPSPSKARAPLKVMVCPSFSRTSPSWRNASFMVGAPSFDALTVQYLRGASCLCKSNPSAAFVVRYHAFNDEHILITASSGRF